MIPALKVLAPGLQTTIQDAGRRGFQDVGVPVCGALDRLGLALANALVGNFWGAPALEILLQGPVLEVLSDSVRVALVGGTGGLEIEGETPRTIPVGQSLRLTRGTRFRARPLGNVACAYLAMEGGVAVPPVLGSASTYVRGAIGGLDGRALLAGDVLPGAGDSVEEGPEHALAAPLDPGFDQPIRVVLGPQHDYFTEAAIARFLSEPYKISAQADRMGFRLDGPKLDHLRGYNIVSDAIVSGSVQVPGSGQPIVLLVDAQTTGGYPKVATVISADIPVLGRRRPGGAVRFEAVSQGEGEALRRAQEAWLRETIGAIQPVREGGLVDAAALYRCNLIGGVVNALREG
jgi:allophanate hydrolase